MKKQNSKEKRRFVRAKRDLVIRHRLYKRRGILIDGSWQMSNTKDMSIAGILFSSEIEYRLADIVELVVVMAGAIDVFKGFSRVVRIERKRNRLFDIAVTFVDSNSHYIKPAKARRAKSYL